MRLAVKVHQTTNPIGRWLLALVLILGLAMAKEASAQTLTTLFSFEDYISTSLNGYVPYTVLVQTDDGPLYGAAFTGGKSPTTLGGGGTIFKVTTGGGEKTTASFCPTFLQCPNGDGPNSLLQGTDGNLYGTTNGGGTTGVGTIFKVTRAGVLTTLHTFCSAPVNGFCPDGSSPNSLIEGTDGNLYGTTFAGGNSIIVSGGAGTIFKIAKSGTLTTLHAFCSATNCPDGSKPVGGLVQATNGNFYGIAGTVAFKISPGGTLTTLATLSGVSYGALIQAADGNLYGTTYRTTSGSSGTGTVFRMTPAGKVKTVAALDGSPYAGLLQGTDGNFYGAIYNGGPYSNPICQNRLCGSLFEVTPSGTVTTLYTFCNDPNCADGAALIAGLMQDTNGTFYGTTEEGGAFGVGTFFSLDVGLGPFITTRLKSGLVGASVTILGNDLTGTTAVTFNGTPATFTVFSATHISATVPTGATSGPVQVTTPTGTLSSNVAFNVTP